MGVTYRVHGEVVADAVHPAFAGGVATLVGVVLEPLVDFLENHRTVFLAHKSSVDEFGIGLVHQVISFNGSHLSGRQAHTIVRHIARKSVRSLAVRVSQSLQTRIL